MNGQGQQVHVFLDRNRLEEGRIFSSDFAKALIKSLVVVPILSSAALVRMFDLKSNSNFISNLFSDGGIDKLPEVVCTKVADRVNELLVENGMAPSESMHTHTVRDTVKK